jgi:trans-4-hydroxy-L-proline dehydratase
MSERIDKLREKSFKAVPSISAERARIITRFYRENEGKYSPCMMRALSFMALCRDKTIWVGKEELIVGERGPAPKVVPTFPELTCHTLEDLQTLEKREKVSYRLERDVLEVYEQEIIPYWSGRTMREKIFSHVPGEWKAAYEAGMFTEFMEQRAPGHTTLDDLIYRKGMLDLKDDIDQALSDLDFLNDCQDAEKLESLRAMSAACDASIVFAERHADLAAELAVREQDHGRKQELEEISRICRRVPAHAPRNFREALQMYWFVHLGTITELNGWDSMNPGRLDQHLYPFYKADLEKGILDREQAKELLGCLWIKFNNHPAPPKVGVTAAESGTYNDFTNINLGGLKSDGSDGVNDLSYLLLEVIDEIHLLQPGCNVQISRKTPEGFLREACRVIRKGYGYPSVFNADVVVAEQVRVGKSVEDARSGGTSGCIETGCFGKEAYILTGYLNVPKILELVLNRGTDPLSGKQLGPDTGDPEGFSGFDELYSAFEAQLNYIVDLKVRVNQYIEQMFARYMPAPFLSAVIRDCIENGKDYYNGGPRYNTNYIQCCGIGTVTDSLASLKKHVFESGSVSMVEMLEALAADFEEREPFRLELVNRTPKFGNDEDYADSIMEKVYDSLFRVIDGRPNTKGGQYHLNMLSTTCHVYFGTKLGATPDGRTAGFPESDGTSPSHGADRKGPTAVCKSLGKMDQVKSGGTLLNQRFLPDVLKGGAGLVKLSQLIRGYFRMDGHHIQFNVVDTATLQAAQENPEGYRDLLVRVAGYSDYFCDLTPDLQEEILMRTAQEEF